MNPNKWQRMARQIVQNGVHSSRRQQWTAASQVIQDTLHTIRNEGTWKQERIITTAQGAHIQVNHQRRDVINFCANNYLGLSVRVTMQTNLLINPFHNQLTLFF